VEFVDEAPIVQYVNPSFVEIFGYEREAVPGANLNELIVPENERKYEAIRDDRSLPDETTRVDVRRETANGRRDFLLRGTEYTPENRSDGTYGFAVYTDITEQRERERYLQVLNRVLRHNLRNDMNVVMALAKRLARNVNDEELAGYARTLEANAKEVSTLSEKAKQIEHMLGRRGADTGVIDVAAQRRDVVAEQREVYPDAEFSTDLPDELWIVGDETIQRAVEELVENAIEHTEVATPTLRIETRAAPDRDDRVELCVRDDSPGIPDDEWQVVSGEEEITQVSHESGLGRWLIRWIVESYGGEIYREQRADGTGTTVVFSLPRAEPASRSDRTT
jgi:PAS domain S-box-containing protein